MLKPVLIFGSLALLLIGIGARPDRHANDQDTVIASRADLYARLDHSFADVERAAADRAARHADAVPITVRVTRDEGKSLLLEAASAGRTAEVKVWLDQTDAPTVTEVWTRMQPYEMAAKTGKRQTLDRIETVLLQMSNELRAGRPVDIAFAPSPRPAPRAVRSTTFDG